MVSPAPYRQPEEPEVPQALQALVKRGQERRLQAARGDPHEAPQKGSFKLGLLVPATRRSVYTSVGTGIGAMIAVTALTAMTGLEIPFVNAGTIMVSMPLLYQLLFHRGDVRRTLSWPHSLPFELRGFRRWLESWTVASTDLLLISFEGPAPLEDLEGARTGANADTLSPIGARQVAVHIPPGKSMWGVPQPGLKALQRLVDQTLIPLHTEHPIAHLEISNEPLEVHVRRAVAALEPRGHALAANQGKDDR